MDLSNWTLSPHNPLLRPSKAEDSAVMAGSLLQGGGGIAEGDRACGPNGAFESCHGGCELLAILVRLLYMSCIGYILGLCCG